MGAHLQLHGVVNPRAHEVDAGAPARLGVRRPAMTMHAILTRMNQADGPHLQLHEVVDSGAHEIDASAPARRSVRGERAVQIEQQDGPRVLSGAWLWHVQEALRCLLSVPYRYGNSPMRWESYDVAGDPCTSKHTPHNHAADPKTLRASGVFPNGFPDSAAPRML